MTRLARRSRAERVRRARLPARPIGAVVYAVLTDDGLGKLREASGSHLAQIDELFRLARLTTTSSSG